MSKGIEFEMLQLADPESAKGRKTNLQPVTLIGTQPMVLVARQGLGPAQSANAGELEAMRTGQLANFQRAVGPAR